MSEVYTYNSTHLTLIRDGSVEFTLSAELGQVGSGRVVIDDTAGTLPIVGQKDFSATQSGCSTPLLFRGYVSDRSFSRDAGIDRQPHVGAGRGIAVELQDTNAILGFDAFRTSSANRPAESVATRGAWLLATDQMALVADNGRVSFPSDKGMDAADYRNQYPGDVLADMALASGGYNYHVNDYGSGPELVFRDDNAQTTDSSTLRISNVLSDASSVTLHPFKDAELRRSPSRVYSLLALAYAKGTRYAERTATATAFNGTRVGIISNSNIKTAAKADDELASLLWQHHTEEDVIECTVLATDAQVNLMPPGWRIQAKFSHLANTGGTDYDSFTWFIISEITKKPIVADAGLYEVRLRLLPQEAAPPAARIIQSAFARGFDTGNTLTLPNPVTIGSTLLYVGATRNSTTTSPPNTGITAPRWGAGAWTQISTSKATPVDSVGMYYKTADSTSQVGSPGTIAGGTHYLMGIWELAGVDMGSVTVQTVNNTSGVNPRATASLGTVAVGSVAMSIFIVDDTGHSPAFPWGGPAACPGVCPPVPVGTAGTGWTTELTAWPYDHYSGCYFLPAHPQTVIMDALGTGAALTPSVTMTAGTWTMAAIAVAIPPL